MSRTVTGPGAVSRRSADVSVVGGGVIGLALAWRAARAGLSVILADPAPGSGASHVAAGMLAPVAEAQFGEPDLLQLNLEASRRYPAFIAELEDATGIETGYLACGSLLVARDADDTAAIERDFQHRLRLGLAVERLSGRDCRRLEPRLAPGIRGGVLAAGDHQVDPRRLQRALIAACERDGVTVVRGRAAVRLPAGRVDGVEVDGVAFRSGQAVLAAGCWSSQVPGVPSEMLPPVHPVKGQILRLAGGQEPLTGHVIRGVEGYVLARRDGEVVAGATAEERGFDTTVTAGAVYEILRNTRELIPDVAELELREASAGLRPGSPDGAPLLGRTPVPGLLLATGHHRNGVLLAPVTADALTAMLRGEAPPDVAAPFAPDRFAAHAAVPA